ncbi:hypothetical protein HOK51_03260 [Candidatus Woesearchaeota archaeon]|jgi:hypothetical protein|nr:hypothetical protein [Candidatus Woesearchaeota archaeon]MBT6518838.1 hypothetical protein [Candidatus Woesearchaeota archaeon]MBT7367977.1 hypothetical protein [Candidatus Woesearchaeota archaeon]
MTQELADKLTESKENAKVSYDPIKRTYTRFWGIPRSLDAIVKKSQLVIEILKDIAEHYGKEIEVFDATVTYSHDGMNVRAASVENARKYLTTSRNQKKGLTNYSQKFKTTDGKITATINHRNAIGCPGCPIIICPGKYDSEYTLKIQTQKMTAKDQPFYAELKKKLH